MQIHYFQHVPFEGLGSMAHHFSYKGYGLSATRLYSGETPPPLDTIDWLIIMGGPMSVHDQSRYNWLAMEKAYIQKAITAGKKVLGICLGAQLIATVLGARVYQNAHREIGWFPIDPDMRLEKTLMAGIFSPHTEVFHWHGETFDLPSGAIPLGSSQACRNQGFIVDNRIVGLQFHLETTPASARALVDNCGDELDNTQYVQTPEQILADTVKFETINNLMVSLLDRLEK